MSKLESDAKADLSSTVEMITNLGYQHLQEVIDLRRYAVVVGASIIDQGIESLFYSLLVGAWGNFETLTAELWESAVNEHPSILAALRGKSAGRFNLGKALSTSNKEHAKSIALDDLERYNYAVETKMGTVYVESRKVTFDSLNEIRQAYAMAFSTDYDEIDRSLKAEVLDVASQIRHVIAHRAGKIDESYLRRTSGLTSAPPGVLDDSIQLDGEIVSELLVGLLRSGTLLTAAVDTWLRADHK